MVGVYAGDAGEEEVGFAEVEEWGKEQGGHGCGGVDLGFAGREEADGAVGKAVGGWVEGIEAGDGDVFGEEVAEAAGFAGVLEPGVGFGLKLE